LLFRAVLLFEEVAMTDSERVRLLERKLSAWRRGALALACATLVAGTAGIGVANGRIGTLDSTAPTIPAETLTLELPNTKDASINAKDLAYNFQDKSFTLTGQTHLKWGGGYALNAGSAYTVRLQRMDEQKDGRAQITIAPAAAPNATGEQVGGRRF
jgi:hypothetical protein